MLHYTCQSLLKCINYKGMKAERLHNHSQGEYRTASYLYSGLILIFTLCREGELCEFVQVLHLMNITGWPDTYTCTSIWFCGQNERNSPLCCIINTIKGPMHIRPCTGSRLIDLNSSLRVFFPFDIVTRFKYFLYFPWACVLSVFYQDKELLLYLPYLQEWIHKHYLLTCLEVYKVVNDRFIFWKGHLNQFNLPKYVFSEDKYLIVFYKFIHNCLVFCFGIVYRRICGKLCLYIILLSHCFEVWLKSDFCRTNKHWQF